VPWRKRPEDIAALAALQRSLLARAAELTKPGGLLVYCTCSLEPEEGIAIAADALSRDARLRRRPISPAEVGGIEGIITPDGDLRTLPCHLGDPDPRMGGLDGFFAARFERI
jgi:16S rRNA (cytosine967-C5)-methyltransferase